MSSVWGSAFAGAVPLNQINALPLMSVQQFLAGDGADTVVINTHTLKYWDPLAVGILDATPGLTGLKYHLTTNWLDVTPCMFYVFGIRRTIPGGDNVAAGPFRLCMQYKQTPTDAPPVTNDIVGINDAYNGIWDLTAGGASLITFPALAGPAVERRLITISPNSAAGSTVQNVALAMGPSVRFQMNWLTLAPPVTDHSTYTMSIWGSSS